MIIQIFQIIIGISLILFGRRLYWWFVAAIGFIGATEWAVTVLDPQPAWVIVIIGLVVGVIGALLAIFFRAASFGIAGFIGGALVFNALAGLLDLSNTTAVIVMLIVGAILGLIAVILFLDWALIVLSSIIGAGLLTGLFPVTGLVAWIILIVLGLIGIIFQARQLGTLESLRME